MNQIASSEIEGVILNTDQVRSSVARRMGVQITGDVDIWTDIAKSLMLRIGQRKL
ncbi:MAG: DUF4172 domain-containing protein [Bacteroidales bacterium]